jgi:hypothetical protein
MTAKTWSAAEVRAVARQFMDGRRTRDGARGEYFRALIETAQAELDGKADQAAQRVVLKAVHRRFYKVVWETIATDEILAKDEVPRSRFGKERNRRLNFARSSHGTIAKWLRAPEHDLMKLDAKRTSKSQLEHASVGLSRKHALTPERIKMRARKLTDGLVGFAKQVAKEDKEAGVAVLREAMDHILKQLAANASVTTDPKIAARENRPLRVGGNLFVPAESRRSRLAA